MTYLDLKPQSDRCVESCVLLLHGYGASGHDLISLGAYWQKALPNTLFVAPHAPQPFEGGMFGSYQWFSLMDRSLEAMQEGVNGARPYIDDLIDQIKKTYGLSEKKVACVGFSQGTMVSLSYALNHSTNVAGVLGYSGVYIPNANEEDIQSKPPVTLIHGEVDDVLPVDMYHQSREALVRDGITVEGYTRPELGHGIDDWGLTKGADVLKDWLVETNLQIKGE